MKLAKSTLITLTAGFLGTALVSCSSTGGKRNSSYYNSEDGSSASGVALQTIHFDFDRYDIRADQRAKADEMARSLKSHPKSQVQIQGNTDDRGSVEYNMALGTKRAESLKKYLVASGVDSDRIDIVSYGKERPAVQGDNESAWAQNRRDDVVQIDD